MYEYTGILMTDNTDSNGNKFTLEALADLVKNQPKVPVRVNFSGNPIGSTKKFDLIGNGDQVLCHFEITYPDMDSLGLYLVPGCSVDLKDIKKENDSTVIQKMKLTEVSLTTIPADASLTKIKLEELY